MQKRILLALVVLCTLASCHKHSTTTCLNTVTLNDGSGTYTECGDTVHQLSSVGTGQIIFNCVAVALMKPFSTGYTYDSSYTISLFAAMGQPFTLGVQYATSGTGGIGVYTLHPQDSSINTFYEGFSGKTYECSGGTINVINADSHNVSGTYTINVFDATVSKTIYGTFNANNPTIKY